MLLIREKNLRVKNMEGLEILTKGPEILIYT